MSKKEFRRLLGYWRASRPSPWKPVIETKGRRHIKGHAKGVGQVLKNTRIMTQVRIEM